MDMTDVDCVDEAAIDQGDLLRYAQGPVPAELAVHLRAHLDACVYCTRLLEEYRAILRERRARRRYIASGAAAVLFAVAVGAGLFFRGEPRHVPAMYSVVQVKGVVARTMAAEEQRVGLPPVPWLFVPGSLVEVLLTPNKELAQSRGDVKMAIFTALPGQALERVARPSVLPEGEARYRAFRVRAHGAELFGPTPGAKQLVFAFSLDEDVFAEAAGLSFEQARVRLTAAQWLAYDVVYKLE